MPSKLKGGGNKIMMKKQIVVVGLMVIIGAIAFFGGMKYQQTKRFGDGNFQQFGMRGNRIMGSGGEGGNRMVFQGIRPVNGEIIASDENSVTVKMEDGSSKIVMISDSTQINKAEKVEKSELKVGEKIAAFGEEKEGIVTANMIQLNPMLQMDGRIQLNQQSSPLPGN